MGKGRSWWAYLFGDVENSPCYVVSPGVDAGTYEPVFGVMLSQAITEFLDVADKDRSSRVYVP